MDTNKTSGISVKPEIPDGKEWVNARSLHQELGIKTLFPAWIQSRIKRYGFIQGKDYQISFSPSNRRRGKRLKEYALSIDMAKKLTMVEHQNNNPNAVSIMAFNFEGRKLRVIDRDGKLWFATRDIARLLDKSQCSTTVTYNLDDNDRTTILIPDKRCIRGMSTCKIISEYGLLCLVFRSNMPQAVEIRKWIVNEALPQIRKAYAISKKKPLLIGRLHSYLKSMLNKSKEAQDE